MSAEIPIFTNRSKAVATPKSGTTPLFSDRPKAAPTPKLRALVKFPGNIVGTTGIEVTKANGTATIETDWTDFSSISAIPTSPTSHILTFDSATGVYALVPSHLLGGAVAGIADAPVDGHQYARQPSPIDGHMTWTTSDFTQAGVGAVTRSMQDKARERISALDFAGVDPTGATDSSTGLQNWLNALVARGGGHGHLPAGKYVITTGLLLNLSTTSLFYGNNYVTLSGDGFGNTQIVFNATAASAALTLLGGISTHIGQFTVEGIFFAGNGFVGGQGVVLESAAYSNLKDCYFSAFDTAVLVQDVNSAYFMGCFWNFNTTGLKGQFASATSPNAINFYSCIFGHSSTLAVQLVDCTNVNFIGGSIEGNGYNTGAGTFRGAVEIVNTSAVADGINGGVACNFDGVYFEANNGTADIWFIAGSLHNPSSMRVTGCNFNRNGDVSDNVINNIRVDLAAAASKTYVTLIGNGFRGFRSYVPSSGTPYVNIATPTRANWNVVDLGNVYESDLERPVFPGPVKSGAAMASCWVNFVGATAAIHESYNVGTLVRNSTGNYTLTFGRPLATATYALVGSVDDPGMVLTFGPSTTSVVFKTVNPSGVATDFTNTVVVVFGGGDLV